MTTTTIRSRVCLSLSHSVSCFGQSWFGGSSVVDIVTRLREKSYDGCKCVECEAADEIERLRGIAEELADAFQQVTDHGDACPICWESFKATRKAENCYGHAAVIELEARRG